jgi:hypothetical protein
MIAVAFFHMYKTQYNTNENTIDDDLSSQEMKENYSFILNFLIPYRQLGLSL